MLMYAKGLLVGVRGLEVSVTETLALRAFSGGECVCKGFGGGWWG